MLYLPVGAPGCGKSSLAAWAVTHNVITPDAIVCPDDLRAWMTGNRAEQGANRFVFEVVDRIILTRLRWGQDVWLDATNFTGFDRQVRKAQEHHAKVVVIMFNVDERELHRRNQIRKHPVPNDVLLRMIERQTQFKGIPADETLTDEEFKERYGN